MELKPWSPRAAAVLLLIFAFAGRALAQPAAPSTQQNRPTLTAPVAQTSTNVPFPAGASGEGIVELELVVERDGSVSRAEVISGPDPFAAHAQRAALEWRFLPARRGDVVVAAKIRARVTFRQEDAAPAPTDGIAGADGGTATPPQSAISTAEEEPEEVRVRGTRREIGETSISADDVREMPGAFGDPFRSIEALPGVTPALSGLPYFFVRGAPPNNSGFFVDGIRVPTLFHVGFGPGVIHPGLLDRVDFYPGAAPASFGRFAGAIVAGRTREPSANLRGELSLRIVDAGALVEAPFASGRGNALVAGRYGYPGPVVGLFSETSLDYWDYQTRASWKLGERDTIGVFAFGSHDYLATKDERNGQMHEQLVTDFHRLDVRYDRALRDGRARVALTLGYTSQGADPIYLTNTSIGGRFEIDQRVSSNVRVRAGADVEAADYSVREEAPRPNGNEHLLPSTAKPPPMNVAWGAHADVVWRVAPRVEIVPGVRADVFESTRENLPAGTGKTHTRVPAVDPRLSTRVILTPSLAWLSTVGLAHQYPALRIGELPGIVASGSGFPPGTTRLQTSAQASQGAEVLLPADFVMNVTGFLSSFTGLTDLTANCYEPEPPTTPPRGVDGPPPPLPFVCPSNAPVRGRAYGVELLVRRPLTKRISGWISYTLSRATREANFYQLDGTYAKATVPSEFDRTHVLSAILAVDLGRRWRTGGRFVMMSGQPYSRYAGAVPVAPYNAFRDSPFYRVDVRLEKRWLVGKSGSVALVFEGQNVTLSKEKSSLGQDCNGRITPQEGGTTQCRRAEIGPITVPSIGVEGSF